MSEQRAREAAELIRREWRRGLPRGLVHHHQVVALQTHAQASVGFRRRRTSPRAEHAHDVAWPQAHPLGRVASANLDERSFDEPRSAAPAELRAVFDQKLVEPFPALLGPDLKTTDSAHQCPETPAPSGMPSQPSCGRT